MPSLKEEILSRINYRQIFGRYLELPTGSEGKVEVKVKCPFHNDETPSMSINVTDGMWKCFGCDEGGDIFKFVELSEKVDFKEALKILAREVGIVKKTISKEDVNRWNSDLMNFESVKLVKFWVTERNVTPEVLNRLKVGWDGERYTIPVMDEDGDYINVRRYKPGGKKDKMKSYAEGYGAAYIFPIDSLSSDSILLVEGEPDVLCAISNGYNAATSTAGAMSFPRQYAYMFKDKDIAICYDNDEAGRKGAVRTANILKSVAREIKIVKIPAEFPKDFTDFFATHKKTKDDFDKLLAEAKVFEVEIEETNDEDFQDVSLIDATVADLNFKKIKTRAIVAGKTISPYIIPSLVTFECDAECDKSDCFLMESGGKKTYEMRPDTDDALRMVGKTKSELYDFLKGKGGIPTNCRKAKIKIEDNVNVEVVKLIPDFEYSANKEREEYVITNCFIISHGIHHNQPYELRGLTMPNPKTQEATHLFSDYKEIRDGISDFKVDDDLFNKLKVFQTDNVGAKLSEIYNDLSHNVTKIFFRNDLLLALDLVYHSALSFEFMGQTLDRAWAECVILGDTQTGKSETANRILHHYRCGEFISGENCSYAGLVGGLANNGNLWSVFWGKLPLNNKRLVIIDEMSGMEYEEIQNLTGIRSSGIAEVTKVQIQQKAPARTRAIYLGNPRTSRPLNTYNYGCLALRELIGRPEDISRFEIGMTVTRDEVDMSKVYEELMKKVPHVYTSELCHKLVIWAWSRQPEHIIFSEGTSECIWSHSLKLAEEYESSDIPLVSNATMKVKIARLAVALAIRLFSTQDGEHVIVKSDHVDSVAMFLRRIYSKRSMDLSGYANRHKDMMNIKNESAVKNKLDLLSETIGEEFLKHLLNMGQIRLSDIQEAIGDKEQAKAFIKEMLDNRCIEKKHNFYVKTTGFIIFLKNMLENKRVEETCDLPDF